MYMLCVEMIAKVFLLELYIINPNIRNVNLFFKRLSFYVRVTIR